MPTDHRAKLATIKRFDQLIAYLRDEMGWPIGRDSFEDVDDLFYDFTADELGIDPKTAAKIQEIKRLRPLSPKQPWGIFFVKFEPKKLPVVALRRILSQVALKKRASANNAERAAWAADDLLFVSNYGAGEERQISFAHFSRAPDGHDLPTLKVLGWDNLDTALHLDAVARELSEHLAWPEDDADAEAWRIRWRAAFTLGHREVISTSRDLSIRLAELARAVRDRIRTALAIETDKGPLTRLMKAFQSALVHDLDADGFADMYAQTIGYGLLSARIADPNKKTVDDFAAHMRTNPFLRELMETFLKVGGRRGKAGGPGIDFDELGVSELGQLLDDANMEAVVRDFGDRNPREDPVIHFYELFLKEYDAKKRMQRGVFYTPRPVVSYIVRSVDELLRTEFGLTDGLADTTSWGEMAKRDRDLKIPEGVSADQDFVQILDPAAGTGTFLVEVIDVIHKTLAAKWKGQGHSDEKIDALWNEYVPEHLLTRLHGYELMMAPYAIAHLKIGLKLYETGYRFGSDERARIYLTNALEPSQDFSGQFEFVIPALAHEARSVNDIKDRRRFTIAIGNPPYSGLSANMSEHAQHLVDQYKTLNGQALNERKLWLQDDYVKFIRTAQMTIEATGVGVIGYITNHGYLANPTFRGMRRSLMTTFRLLRVLDLHGNANKKERAPDGSNDENVFDIRQGVAICMGIRNAGRHIVSHADLWGARESKYNRLSETNPAGYLTIDPTEPFYFFEPHGDDYRSEYEAGWSITDIFPTLGVGVVMARDAMTVDFDKDALWARINDFAGLPPESARIKYELGKDARDWRVATAQADVRASGPSRKRLAPILYRPFDLRFTYYTGTARGFYASPCRKVMEHMTDGDNLGLSICRSVEIASFEHAFVTKSIIGHHSVSLKEVNYLCPLWLKADSVASSLLSGEQRQVNFSPSFIRALGLSLKIERLTDLGIPRGLQPEEVLFYLYALLYSPAYRLRYSDILKADFPRLPMPGSLELFGALARLGGELVGLHTLESPKLSDPITEFVGRRAEVEKVVWSGSTVWLDKAKTIGFRNVPETVWFFSIGGYQVCEKWLKDRKGRALSNEEIAHYQKIVVALSETIRLMGEIDEVIESNGGWPGAFASSVQTAVETENIGSESSANIVPVTVARRADASRRVAVEPLTTLWEAAEPAAAGYRSQPAGTPEIDREDLICQIRQLFASGGGRSRETAIRELAAQLGYERVGPRIREEIVNAIRTAARRGIVSSYGDQIRIDSRNIEDYRRDSLKDQFLASLQGRAWMEREDAIKNFARWLGFRRTGPSIDEMGRSLINGLIREDRLEADDTKIRRIG